MLRTHARNIAARWWQILVTGTLLLWAVPSSSLAAQAQASRAVIARRVTCSVCQIKATAVLTLGDSAGEGMIGVDVSSITVDSAGNYIVTRLRAGDDRVLVFGRDGNYMPTLSQAFMDSARMTRIDRVVASAHDSLWCMDRVTGRISVLSTRWHLVRTDTSEFLSRSAALVPLEGRGVVVNGDLGTPDRSGWPLHIFDDHLKISRSFGDGVAAYRIDLADLSRRELAAAPTERDFWSAHKVSYVVDRWRDDGSLAFRLIREADWFPKGAGSERPFSDGPLTHIQAIRQDSQGLLWIVAFVPDSRWRDAIHYDTTRIHGEHVEAHQPEIEPRRYWDSIVEVYDAGSGQLLSSRRFDQAFLFTVGDAQLASYEDERGSAGHLVLWRVELTHMGGSK